MKQKKQTFKGYLMWWYTWKKQDEKMFPVSELWTKKKNSSKSKYSEFSAKPGMWHPFNKNAGI